MNTIGLLLVLGLAFFAMKQKSEKTRNMLLVVSALLGFCMFSAEGFTVTAGQNMTTLFTGSTGGNGSGIRNGTTPVTVAGGSNRYIFADNAQIELTGNGEIPDGITCKTGGTGDTTGTVGYIPSFIDDIPSSADIDTYLTCSSNPVNGQACSEAKSGGKACPDYYQDKIADCSADPCVAGDFSGPGTCCEKVCPDADCKDWLVFGLGSGERQECKEELPLGFLKYYCNEDS